jgi:hypothetical protein
MKDEPNNNNHVRSCDVRLKAFRLVIMQLAFGLT